MPFYDFGIVTLSEHPEGRGSPYHDREGRQIGLFKWADLIGDPDYARVSYSELPDGTCISTVWFGVSHNPGKPLIFETIVFSPAGEAVECWRYQTRDEAHAGHDQIVASMTQPVEEREAKLVEGEWGTD